VLAGVDGVSGAILGLTASHALTAIVTLVWVARSLGGRGAALRAGGRRLAELGAAVVFGVKTHLSNVLAFLNYRLDLFILNAVASQTKVGQYSIAVSVTTAVWLLPRALSTVVVPRVAQLSASKASDSDPYRDMVEAKSVRHATMLVAGSSLAAAGLLVALVTLFLGDGFRPSIGLGLILLPGTALLGVGGVLAAIVVGEGKPGYTLLGTVIATPPAIALYVLLVPRLDAVGAALASTLSYALGFIVGAHLFRRATGTPAAAILLPTQSEVDDYRNLLRGTAMRLTAALRGRRGARG
jgi:O-antigen/teichoic acid export membrane protein